MNSKPFIRHTTQNKSLLQFSLVEVALAIAVIGIGVTAIMALFPLGLDATKDAVGANYAGDIMNTFSSYIRTELDNDWEVTISDLPNSKPSVKTIDRDSSWTSTSDSSIFTTATNGLYGVKVQTNNMTDFMADVKIWCSDASITVRGDDDFTTFTDSGKDMMVGINMEISWPLVNGDNYTDRKKRYFYFEYTKH